MLITHLIVFLIILSIIFHFLFIKSVKRKEKQLYRIMIWVQTLLLCIILLVALIHDNYIQFQSRMINQHNERVKVYINKLNECYIQKNQKELEYLFKLHRKLSKEKTEIETFLEIEDIIANSVRCRGISSSK